MTNSKSKPAEYALNHWRQYESQQEHADRVERAEYSAGWYFQQATKPQKAAYDAAMGDLRGLAGPRYDRARKAANEAWSRDTAEAAELFIITCDAIMFHGEVPEEISNLWDDLDRPAERPSNIIDLATATLELVRREMEIG